MVWFSFESIIDFSKFHSQIFETATEIQATQCSKLLEIRIVLLKTNLRKFFLKEIAENFYRIF